MIIFILILLILVWLLIFLFIRWRWNKILAVNFPLFLFCCLLLITDIMIYTNFGENRQLGVAIVWLPIFYWLYIRNPDLIALWRLKPFNLITGLLVGVIFGALGIVFITNLSKGAKTPNWMLGSVFNLIQSAVAEELIFRCLFLSYLKKLISNDFLRNLIQAFVFVLFHLYGVYLHFPALLFILLGFALLSGFMVLKQESAYGSLLAHVITNLIFTAK